MTERISSFFDAIDIDRASENEDPLGLTHSDLDLDWELQRLLGEEVSAMEPASVTSTPARAAVAERVAPREAVATMPEIVPQDLLPYLRKPQEEMPAPTPDPQVDAQTWEVERNAKSASMESNLSMEIDALYQQMTREIGSRTEFTQDVADRLKGAREALLAGPAGIAEAESLVMQAQGMLKRREDSRRWGSSYGALILGYEFLFFLAFVAVLAFEQPLAAWAGSITGVAGATALRDILPFWDTMIWGGMGGVLGALYSLHWHVTEKQDFDRQFNMWYVVQPVMGAMLGAFVYLIVLSGMLAMNTTTSIASTWFPSAVACLFGFRQKFIFELLDKLMEIIGLRPLLNRSNKEK